MSHQVARLPVYTYFQDYSLNNLTIGTPYAITGVSQNVTRLKIQDTSGCYIRFVIGTGANQQTAFTIPLGGGDCPILLQPGMTLWLNAFSNSSGGYTGTVSSGTILITGYQ